jgi:hypothetical protein
LIVGAVALAAVSCSSGDESAEPAPTSLIEPESTTTTAQPTTTAVPETESTLSNREIAEQVFLENAELFRTCVQDPESCDEQQFEQTASGEALENLVARIRRLREEGLVVRVPHGIPEPVFQDFEQLRPDEVRLRVCEVDTGVMVEPGAGPGGADVIIDDAVVTDVFDEYVRLDSDGVWRVFRAELVTRIEGDGGCGV